MTNRDLARIDRNLEIAVPGLTPRQVVAQAKEQAEALMDIVEQCKLYTTNQGKKYLHIEAWQTIGTFNRSTAVTDWTRPVEENGQIVAYESKVDLWRDGVVEGSAVAICFIDGENVTKGKDANGKRQAAMSMSQTRAASKAFRMRYSFVAVLAKYEPTPAEEMDTFDGPPAQRRQEAPPVMNKATPAQINKIRADARTLGWDDAALKEVVRMRYSINSSTEMTKTMASDMIEWMIAEMAPKADESVQQAEFTELPA